MERTRRLRARRALVGAAGVLLIAGAASAAGPLAPERRFADESYSAYLAPESDCPGGEDAEAPRAAQERTMRCLINWARRHAGRRPLRFSQTLSESAELKARDIARCDEFSHSACGKEPQAVVVAAGYEYAGWAEILYSATGGRYAPRPALDAWLGSRGHRLAMLKPIWTEQGVALLQLRERGRLSAIWVSHFGERR